MTTSTSTTPTPDRRGAAHRGPPLVLLGIVHVVLFLAFLVVLDGLTEGSWPMPGTDPDQIAGFLAGNGDLLRVVGMLQFGAAVPLALYAATASSRLRHLGIRAAGTTITLAGGLVAAARLAVAGLVMVTAGASGPAATPATAAILHQLVFVVGGAGYAVFLGLLLAGIAVTSLLPRQLPRWLCWTTLAIAAAAELSTLSLAIEPLSVLVAVGRFGGMLALIAAGALLPNRRPARAATGDRSSTRAHGHTAHGHACAHPPPSTPDRIASCRTASSAARASTVLFSPTRPHGDHPQRNVVHPRVASSRSRWRCSATLLVSARARCSASAASPSRPARRSAAARVAWNR